MGEIAGRFFGPNADELGGAVSASRDVTGTDDDLNLYGYIASRQFGSLENARFCGLLGRHPSRPHRRNIGVAGRRRHGDGREDRKWLEGGCRRTNGRIS